MQISAGLQRKLHEVIDHSAGSEMEKNTLKGTLIQKATMRQAVDTSVKANGIIIEEDISFFDK